VRELVVLLLGAFVLAGCATVPPEQLAAQQAMADRPVACSGTDDCEVKWSRALQWVLDHGSYRIQTQSDMMIATMGPLPNSPLAAFTITKVAQGDGNYIFDFRGGCDNIFGCTPSLVASKASFVQAVMGY
jgi:hypothetical protein